MISAWGALAGAVADNAVHALAAGCDVVLHCNGILDEMAALARRVPPLSEEALERWRASLAWLAARHDTGEAERHRVRCVSQGDRTCLRRRSPRVRGVSLGGGRCCWRSAP